MKIPVEKEVLARCYNHCVYENYSKAMEILRNILEANPVKTDIDSLAGNSCNDQERFDLIFSMLYHLHLPLSDVREMTHSEMREMHKRWRQSVLVTTR